MEAMVMLPFSGPDLDAISSLVRENQSFIALVTGDLYTIQHYLLPFPLRNFKAVLDRNVYTRICSLVRQQPIPGHAVQDHRWAAAVLAFCQVAEISFHYGSSLQEYASTKGGDAAVDEFRSFYLADNCDPRAWIDYAVGRTDRVDLSSVHDLPPINELPAASKFETPIYEFRVNYVFALKLALLDQELALPERKMLKLMDWMEHEFVLGAGALHFGNLLFSPSRTKRMLKKRSFQDLRNIAWDLALIQGWRRSALEGHAASEPVLLVTRDKVVRFIAERLAASDDDEFYSQLVDHWHPAVSKGEAILQRYLKLHQTIEASAGRRILPTDQQLDAITKSLEADLVKAGPK